MSAAPSVSAKLPQPRLRSTARSVSNDREAGTASCRSRRYSPDVSSPADDARVYDRRDRLARTVVSRQDKNAEGVMHAIRASNRKPDDHRLASVR